MVSFLQARDDESLRQQYLDEFLLNYPHDSVSDLRYNVHRKAGLNRVTELAIEGSLDELTANELRKAVYESNTFAFLLHTADMIGRGNQHPIIINPAAFDDLEEIDFVFFVRDHEYFHAGDFKHGIFLPDKIAINYGNVTGIQPNTLQGLLETRAFLYQLQKNQMNDSGSYLHAIKGFLKSHRILRDVTPRSGFEKQVIEAQIKSYQTILPEHLRI